jgi:hypothetical protein
MQLGADRLFRNAGCPKMGCDGIVVFPIPVGDDREMPSLVIPLRMLARALKGVGERAAE